MTTQALPEQPPTLDSFGARLAIIRWAQGWNQKEAALACGLPAASWREWELENRAPRNLVEVATAIAARTGYSDYWVMTGKSPYPGNGRGPDDDGAPRTGLEPVTLCTAVRDNIVRVDFTRAAA